MGPVGGEADRTGFVFGPGVETAIDRAHRRLAECRVGIVGVGEIGREVARAVRTDRSARCGGDVRPAPVPGAWCEVRPFEDLDEMLADSDFVVIAAPHTPRTAGLFDAARLSRMKRTGVLINIGRGAIVRLEDLTRALVDGTLVGRRSMFTRSSRCPRTIPCGTCRTPFSRRTSRGARGSPRRHFATLVENLRRFEAGQPLKNVVDKREWC